MMNLKVIAAITMALIGVFGLIANSFVIAFFKKKYRKTIPFMYIVLAGCDAVSGLVALCHSYIILHYSVENDRTDRKDYFLSANYVVFQTATRASLFYNLVLSIVRTINIIKTFYCIKKAALLVCVILYPIVWSVILIGDSALGIVGVFENIYRVLPGFSMLGGIPFWVIIDPTLFMVLPLILPAVMLLVCAVIQIYSIANLSNISPTSNKEMKMTKTIIMLTVSSLVCNVPYTCLMFDMLIGGFIFGKDMSHIIVTYSLCTVLPMLNTILTPTILLTRGKHSRRFLRSFVTSWCSCLIWEQDPVTQRLLVKAQPGEDRTIALPSQAAAGLNAA